MKKQFLQFLIKKLSGINKIPVFPITIIDIEYNYNNTSHYKYGDAHGNIGYFDGAKDRFIMGQVLTKKN